MRSDIPGDSWGSDEEIDETIHDACRDAGVKVVFYRWIKAGELELWKSKNEKILVRTSERDLYLAIRKAMREG